MSPSVPQVPAASSDPTDQAADAGMAVVEYAIGTVAAAAFALLLLRIIESPVVSRLLAVLFQHALHLPN
ncbi:MAG: DUF4244 domain-containing protein [Mycobacteriales bacterium]